MTDARRVLALLSNARSREAYARVVLGMPVPTETTRQRRALDALIEAGLVIRSGTALEAPLEPLEESLEALPRRAVLTGVDRFVSDGRIVQYPANPDARTQLLEWVAARALEPHEVLSERELGERLELMTDDVAVLRRYLVDAGLLLRTRSGSSYSRAPAE